MENNALEICDGNGTGVKFISLTPEAEEIMAYCARVSSPNQENPEYAKLLNYCIRKGHWSVFETAFLSVQIVTSRAIAQQILRHRSFSFQEFSQRYAAVDDFILYNARRQDDKNRQNSLDDLKPEQKQFFLDAQNDVWNLSKTLYDIALEKGIAKECARFLLPLNVKTKLYMNGTVRSWIHYLQARTAEGVQAEHRWIAQSIQRIFVGYLPVVSEALGWAEGAQKQGS